MDKLSELIDALHKCMIKVFQGIMPVGEDLEEELILLHQCVISTISTLGENGKD